MFVLIGYAKKDGAFVAGVVNGSSSGSTERQLSAGSTELEVLPPVARTGCVPANRMLLFVL